MDSSTSPSTSLTTPTNPRLAKVCVTLLPQYPFLSRNAACAFLHLLAATDEGFRYSGNEEGITLAIEDGPVISFPSCSQPPSLGDVHGDFARHSHPYSLPRPPAHPSANYHNTLEPGTGYHRTPTQPPPPPPPPSNTGFLPSLFPGTGPLPETYVNPPPSSGPARHGGTPGFGMGLGAGALAAGAVIFGDDFMAGSSFPAGLDGGSLTVSADPLL